MSQRIDTKVYANPEIKDFVVHILSIDKYVWASTQMDTILQGEYMRAELLHHWKHVGNNLKFTD